MVKDEVELTNGMQNVKTEQERRKKEKKITLEKNATVWQEYKCSGMRSKG